MIEGEEMNKQKTLFMTMYTKITYLKFLRLNLNS